MITIFTSPKAFTGLNRVIQYNAIRSWLQLRPECEIILFGRDEGTAEAASELGVKHVPDIDCNEYGTPLVSSIFQKAQDMARFQALCYVNADIILLSDFLASLKYINKKPFLVVGQRWDIDLDEPLDFNNTRWEQQLLARIAEYGRLHSVSGIDYFIFSRGVYADMLPFALGRTAWDNWLIYRARSLKIPVIDATKAITAVHQNHDYSHVAEGKTGAFKGPEAVRNQALLGRPENSFSPRHANWVLTRKGAKRALTFKHILYRLDAIPVLHPRLRFLGLPKRILFALSRTVRSIIGKPKV